MTTPTCTAEEVLEQLQKAAPSAPFLALGQTVFWDEPMKAAVALAARRSNFARPFVAGVHDTDYFAKMPGHRGQGSVFRALAHNDTTTKGLWSAAGEFSTLFGSETVVTREVLLAAGMRVDAVARARPDLMDEATEAWGWRAVVSTEEDPPVTADLPLRDVEASLLETLDWALEQTLSTLGGESRSEAEEWVSDFRQVLDQAGAQAKDGSLADYYRSLLPELFRLVSGSRLDIESTATSELLRFNRRTWRLPRFELLGLFINPATRDAAKAAYDEAIQGSGLYSLDRFGSGAIPFDAYLPGVGRGTIRIGNRGIVVMTPKPRFVSLRNPVECLRDLAEAFEREFADQVVVVGKAVTLIGMLAREYVFVFHEGASSYVRHSRALHERLANLAPEFRPNPILRVRYSAWDALQACCSWIRLPEPFRRPFGTEEICAPSFAARWREVVREQESLLAKLGELRRPIDLIRFLDSALGGSWERLAVEYEDLHRRLDVYVRQVDQLRAERVRLYERKRTLKRERIDRERAKGSHFRERIFERTPSAADSKERERLSQRVDAVVHEQAECENQIRALMRRQDALVQDEAVQRIHDRRRTIELEAELKRMRLIQEAVAAARGLTRAGQRPSAWWFPLLCPDGLWFAETARSAEYYLEPLV